VSGFVLTSDAASGGFFTNLLLLTILFIFVSAIVGAIVARRRRDRCLALFDDYHITMAKSGGQVLWGDLRVFSQGIELSFDAPYRSQQGVIKSSYLLYQPEMEQVVAFCRYVGYLTEDERRTRTRQVEARFRPGLIRRVRRSMANVLNTVRDAFAQAMNAVIGQMAKVGGKSSVAGSQKGEMERVGKSLLGAVGNAYEPMLERQIGKPIVIEMASPADPDGPNNELCGYLAEYSDKYLAMFNVEHSVQETLTVPCDDTLDRDDLKIEVDSASLRITNKSSVPLIVDAVISDQEETQELGVVLTRTSTARLSRMPGQLSVRLLRVQRIDVICHRTQAVIRYASLDELPSDDQQELPPPDEDESIASS
jgi:hypothetical protein